MRRSLDVVLFGATGYTGQLVAEALRARSGDGLAWALAGRSRQRLADVRDRIGAPVGLPLIAADATDPAALAELAGRARVVISTVGPYQMHGASIVGACARAGTDYVDLCGEPAWMAQMIARLQAPSRASGARIVFSCGFDSIPFDLGVVVLQHAARRRFGRPLVQVRGRVHRLRGGLSGGTAASALATCQAAARDPRVARTMADPFALTPGFSGPPQPDGQGAVWDDWAQAWAGPFMMATINTKNVHRTNALRDHPWGRDFVYDERHLTGDGPAGHRKALALAAAARVQDALLGFAPTRALLARLALPRPGSGPSAEQRERGGFELGFTGQTADGRRLHATVRGERDPGYGATSRMIAESALCLLHDVDHHATGGGVWTPGAAMGLALVRRLEAHAGLRFTVDG